MRKDMKVMFPCWSRGEERNIMQGGKYEESLQSFTARL